jgi:hypothetical protein
MVSPSPTLASLNASESGRSPKGTAMLAASSRKHIARADRLGSGPALGPLASNAAGVAR